MHEITREEINKYIQNNIGQEIAGKKLISGRISLKLFYNDTKFIEELVRQSLYSEWSQGEGYIKKVTDQAIILNDLGNTWFKKTYMTDKIAKPKIIVPIDEWEAIASKQYIDEEGKIRINTFKQNEDHQSIVENNVWKSTSTNEHSENYKSLILARDDNVELNQKTKEPRKLDDLTKMYHAKHLIE